MIAYIEILSDYQISSIVRAHMTQAVFLFLWSFALIFYTADSMLGILAADCVSSQIVGFCVIFDLKYYIFLKILLSVSFINFLTESYLQ